MHYASLIISIIQSFYLELVRKMAERAFRNYSEENI